MRASHLRAGTRAPVAEHDAVRRDQIVGDAPAFLAALELARRLAPTRVPLLLAGETGTGKELVARFVHGLSGRHGPLVDVDCGALPSELMESMLFGHVRGAFTGASDATEGLIAAAHGGTLFLDELGSLKAGAQAALLRVLEDGRVRPVGGLGTRAVDLRLITTVQPAISTLVDHGGFRADLLHRVAGAVIRLPTLAERPQDVVPLARYFANKAGVGLDVQVEGLLLEKQWPGNIRELRWTVIRAAHLCHDGVIDTTAMDDAFGTGAAIVLGTESNRAGRRRELESACRAHSGDPDAAAAALGISRSTLYRRLADEGLDLRALKRRPPGPGSSSTQHASHPSQVT